MRFIRLLLTILVVGVLAVYCILGTDYGEQNRQKTSLALQIAEAEQQLALIPPVPTDLEQRQAEAVADLDAVKNAFPGLSNTTRIVDTALKLAEESSVRAVPMVTQPWSIESVNKIDYPVFRFTVTIKGTYMQLADFINRLENGEPETLVIQNLTIDRVSGMSPDAGDNRVEIPVDASLDIAVYARPSVTETPEGVGD